MAVRDLHEEKHDVEDPLELSLRLLDALRPVRISALKKLCTVSSSAGGLPENTEKSIKEGLRSVLLGAEQSSDDSAQSGTLLGREAERLLAYELLYRADPLGSKELISDDEAVTLSEDLLKLSELRWAARGQYRYGLAPVASLLTRWTSAGYASPTDSLAFAIRAAQEQLSKEDGAEEEGRLSMLGRCGCGRLTGTTEENHEVLAALMKACASQGTKAQCVGLEILAFLCGKDSDLKNDGADTVSKRFPVAELWMLMADVALEEGISDLTPWHWWVIPLLQQPGASSTSLIDVLGFLAACADSPVLISAKVFMCRPLLDALRSLTKEGSGAGEEVRAFADATGRHIFRQCFPDGAPS
eukprot:TRINITY_DN3343_c0_g1_i2.p1 TRINITY_DN3343_c0_g1~~TRINITY_DN3343_c0_g1_i2.p1  ORF type:complete len:374 (+),score=84.78 TRINITY_DN3343_c0_g1_i2:54-1124(+)